MSTNNRISGVVTHEFYTILGDPEPPSVNRMYTAGYRGRRILSKEGERFKSAMTQCVVQEIAHLPWRQAVDQVYVHGAGVRLVIGLSRNIFVKSWKPGSRTPKGELQSPYQKLDATNYIKVIEDAIVDATGIDDNAHIEVMICKWQGDSPLVEVSYEVFHDPRTRLPYGARGPK
jgi:Holliday junction resolvase RusA-like endonuclease